MLYSIDKGEYVKKLPHKKEFDKWRSNLSDSDYLKIVEAINDKIDLNDINTAGWLPGNDWTGSVFQPLYYACKENKVQSGLFFGLIVFNILMLRPDNVWGFGRFENNGVPIASMTYFILENPPPIR